MSLQVEKLENNMAKLTIEVAAEELDKAIEMAKAKVLDLVREQVSAVVIDVTMIPVGNVQDYPMCIGSAMYIE